MQQSQEMMMVIGLVVALLLMMMQKQHTNRGTNTSPFWKTLDKCRETMGPEDTPCFPGLCRGNRYNHADFPCRGLDKNGLPSNRGVTYDDMVRSFGGKTKMDAWHKIFFPRGMDTWSDNWPINTQK